jgi:ectoine hydroxylase-related dioxygenase (phytanoyl-CoA dioxygenase family)
MLASANPLPRPIDIDARAGLLVDQLLDQGYLIIPDVIDADTHQRFHDDLKAVFAETPFCKGPFYGETTRRFGRLLIRSPMASRFACHPLILAIAHKVLLHEMCNTILLNLTQAIEIHPGAPLQYPHRDQDMFGGEKGKANYMLNVMWPLDDFTGENGATRLWPHSNQGDPDGMLSEAEAISAVAKAGSAILFLGSTLHSGGENRSQHLRRGVIFSYCQGWLRPWENPWLAYPPAVAKQFDEQLQALVGYRQHLPSLGNFEGQCPSVLLQGEVPEHLQFIDSLRPDQTEWVREYQRANSLLSAA